MLEVLDLELLAAVAKVDHVAGRARRRHGRDLVERELALGEDVEDLAPDIARRPDDRDPITHVVDFLDCRRRAERKRAAQIVNASRAVRCGDEGGRS